ncbi:MAG: hypothetical protein IPJ65_05005 [Archangiaceae bacterium]|nr:hypothetical protein [Archangiaceae bacterium]
MPLTLKPRPTLAPTPKPLSPQLERCTAAKAGAATTAPVSTDTFESREATAKKTTRKIESIWKDGNISSTDDWQKS